LTPFKSSTTFSTKSGRRTLSACREKDVAVIARVPFDEGSLTGTLTLDSKWPKGDWRSTYFVPENLKSSIEHADALKPLVPADSSMAEMALRFILNNPDVSTIIPGMRKIRNVEANLSASDKGPLPPALHQQLRAHRWTATHRVEPVTMNYRRFGRTGWQVSDIGYGMWGMGAWTGSDDAESLAALQRSIDLGCNFFDTAWVYGNGHSEKLLGEVLRKNSGTKLYVATKVPPKNREWPARASATVDESYPPAHIEEYVGKSLQNLGLDTLDLIQLHTWQDKWLGDTRLVAALEKLKSSGKVRALGISLNRWEPFNGVKAVRAGIVDAVQVVYNIFDQNPEDELFPACREKDVAVIARVPFDEGSLTGTLTRDSKWPEGDWRNIYFTAAKLPEILARVDALKPLLRDGISLPELALRFILSNSDVAPPSPACARSATSTPTLPPAAKPLLRPI